MDLCMSACLEFVALPKAGYVPAVMQQGKIYDCAGVVFGKRSALSLLQLKLGTAYHPLSRYTCFLIQLQWPVVDLLANKGPRQIMHQQAHFKYAKLSAWHSIYFMLGAHSCCLQNAKKRNLHVVISISLTLPKGQSVCFSVELSCVARFVRKWQGIPSFLLLSNVRDFLIWWINQVAPHGGACPKRVELPVFFLLFMLETFPVVSVVW